MPRADVCLIDPKTLPPQARANTVGDAHMTWCLPIDSARAVHTGMAWWDDAQAPAKTLDYDEFLYVLAGSFGVTLQDRRCITAQAGQVLFIPKGTTVQYHGKQARLFFAISTPDSTAQSGEEPA